jgi:AraC family transcriptional regulator of adaptative response / DNA-3-methyladenine glycosylase II
VELDRERCYEALRTRDRRFDGRFFVAVSTTGIYCRPICPARLPLLRNILFYRCAAAAEGAGFRACRRCRPETAPGTPAWLGTSAIVSRGLRLIEAGALDDGDVGGLASRLGVGARQLRRLFARHLGASPAEIARARRVHFARLLIDQSDRPMTELAFAAGFASVRQFNHAFRQSFGRSPRDVRRTPAEHRAAGRCWAARGASAGESLALRLAYRPPFDWEGLAGFLAGRAIAGVESVADGCYRRTVELAGAPGWIEVRPLAGEAALELRVALAPGAELLRTVERVRRIFDLDADPLAIGEALESSARLRPHLLARPGLRVPGAWDAFELGVRAILGQQVSVRGASTLAGRLVREFGKPVEGAPAGLSHLFPSPAHLAESDVASIGLPRARAEAIRGFARAIACGELILDGARGLDDAVARLAELPGIGSWTAQYVAMRALGEPDAFPAGDLALRKALSRGDAPISAALAERLADEFRPWRSYAAMALWRSLAARSAA